MTRKFMWDGEKIKETVAIEPKKHSTKDILNGLDNIRKDINQLGVAENQLKTQVERNKSQMRQAKEFEKELREFEEQCINIQITKLKGIIASIHDDCYAKAKKSAEETIAKTPEAYTEEQKKQLPFLDYQKLLATNEQVAEKISKRIITQNLYENPIFDNPFKG